MKTAVHCPTQEDYDRLMVAYEKKGWRLVVWADNLFEPTAVNYWDSYGVETCVGFKDRFGCCYKNYYKSEGYEIITVDQAIDALGEGSFMFRGNEYYFDSSTGSFKNFLARLPDYAGEVEGDYLVTSSGKRAEIKPINSLSNPTTMDKIKSAIRGVSKKVQLRRKHKIETVEGDLTSYGQEVILNLLWKGVKPEELKDEVDKILKNLED